MPQMFMVFSAVMQKWPGADFPPLNIRRQREPLQDDFVHYWHCVLPKKFSVADRFGHEFIARTAPAEFERAITRDRHRHRRAFGL